MCSPGFSQRQGEKREERGEGRRVEEENEEERERERGRGESSAYYKYTKTIGLVPRSLLSCLALIIS